MAWKNTMQVFHTSGVPPSNGRIILPIIGWTRKRSVALVKRVSAKARSMYRAKGDTHNLRGFCWRFAKRERRFLALGRLRRLIMIEGLRLAVDPGGASIEDGVAERVRLRYRRQLQRHLSLRHDLQVAATE